MLDCHAVESEKGRAGIVMRIFRDREWGVVCRVCLCAIQSAGCVSL